MKVVIIGGVAGGATAAARIRRLDENAQITIFERSNYISYANCGMPYYIGDEILEKDNLTLQSPKSFKSRYNIDVKVKHEVIEIIPDRKVVIVKDLSSGNVFEEKYDKLLLAPGAKPITPIFLDKDIKNVFTIRTVEDTYQIKDFLNIKQPKKVLVIGGGFVGLEMVENIHNLGIDVTLIQNSSQLLNMLDYDMASFIHHHIRSKNINILFNTNVVKVTNIENKVLVSISENNLEFDAVIVSIGIKPESDLAKKTGIKLGNNDSIIVDDMMQTSISDIYAVGDAVAITHAVSNQKKLISLAGPANKQARIAADNICGMNSYYKGSIASSVIKVFDMTAAKTGLNEREIKEIGYDYDKVILSPTNHASYYPNAKVMTLKVLYDKKSLEILGAQAVGYDGVDKRIDVIATAIFTKLKAPMLKDLDLVYAPPYSSSKDPVNLAGYIIDNLVNGVVKQFSYEEIESLRKKEDVILLDSRTPYEYSRGCANGFINIPLDELREKLSLLDKGKKIYVMCQSGMRSYLATRILTANGFDAYNFIGGYRLYSSMNLDEKLIK